MGMSIFLLNCKEESIFSESLKDISSIEGTLMLVYDIWKL